MCTESMRVIIEPNISGKHINKKEAYQQEGSISTRRKHINKKEAYQQEGSISTRRKHYGITLTK